MAYLKEQHELKQYKLLTNQSNYRLSEKGEGDINREGYKLTNIMLENDVHTDSCFYQRVWKYTIPVNYKPGIVTIANIQISETLFDYLETKGILKPFEYSIYHVDRLYKYK